MVVLVLRPDRGQVRIVVERGAVPAQESHGEPGEVDVGERAQDQTPVVLDGTLDGRGEGGLIGEAPRHPLDLREGAELLGFLEATESEVGEGAPGRGHGLGPGPEYLTPGA